MSDKPLSRWSDTAIKLEMDHMMRVVAMYAYPPAHDIDWLKALIREHNDRCNVSHACYA